MATMKVGDVLEFKHIPFNVKEQFPFKAKTICMLIGGTGIAPMIQALHAILGTEGNSTHVKMIYANRTEQDILAKDTIDAWAAASGGRYYTPPPTNLPESSLHRNNVGNTKK